ncbi:MAG: type II secretion system protein [Magnetococcales bacterium]|nr:type II secretion system protein [Magnetococcales bacterium]
MTQSLRNKSGFTLTEMAMVMLIVGILASLGMSFLNATMNQTSYTVTKQRMAAIKEAMISYLRVNGRLPCPDTVVTAPTGAAAASCSSPVTGSASNALDHVDTSFGILPWQTLGLQRDAVLDGWGNFFTYHVSAVNGSYYFDWTIQRNFSDTDKGEFTIQQKNANGGSSGSDVQWVVLAIVSHGPNGNGAYTVKGTRNVLPTGSDELENTNGNVTTITNAQKVTYVKRDFSDNSSLATGAFDDIVDYMTVADLVGPLIKEGSSKSESYKRELTQKRVETTKDKLVSWYLTNNRLPCPDSNVLVAYDGIEDPRDSNMICNYPNGILPYVTLGIPYEIISDGWGNYFIYHVSNKSVSSDDNWTDETIISERNHGKLSVNNFDPVSGTVISTIPDVVIMVFSFGESTTYVSRGYAEERNIESIATGNYYSQPYNPTEFNDIFGYITASDITTAKIRSGSKSASAKLTEQFSSIRNILIGAMLKFTGATCQFSTLATLGWADNDPWGTAFEFVDRPAITNGTLGTAAIFTIRSWGPNKTNDSGLVDDVKITMTKSEGVGLFTGTGINVPNCLQ